MKKINYKDVTPKIVDDPKASKATIRVLLSEEDGAPNFAMRLFEVEPGGNTPFHKHTWEHETFIKKGAGKFIGENREVDFKEGDALYVEPDELHQFKNTGEESLEIICIIPSAKKCTI